MGDRFGDGDALKRRRVFDSRLHGFALRWVRFGGGLRRCWACSELKNLATYRTLQCRRSLDLRRLEDMRAKRIRTRIARHGLSFVGHFSPNRRWNGVPLSINYRPLAHERKHLVEWIPVLR